MNRDFLRAALVKESRAYGFTIAFWGSGAMLISEHGLPNMIEALSYGGGAVLGFGFLTLLAYRRALGIPNYEKDKILILGMVHYISALLPIVIAAYLAHVNPSWASFGLTGIVTSVSYNLGMLVEEALSEKIRRI